MKNNIELNNNNNAILQHLAIPDPDQTIEVLMTDLDPDIMSIFNKEECNDAKEATQVRI
jgi:S-adenosylmethionine decarboxylase